MPEIAKKRCCCCGSAHIDDDFDEKEMSFVEEAARALEIDERLVLELNQLILDYKLLQVRAGKIMEG